MRTENSFLYNRSCIYTDKYFWKVDHSWIRPPLPVVHDVDNHAFQSPQINRDMTTLSIFWYTCILSASKKSMSMTFTRWDYHWQKLSNINFMYAIATSNSIVMGWEKTINLKSQLKMQHWKRSAGTVMRQVTQGCSVWYFLQVHRYYY